MAEIQYQSYMKGMAMNTIEIEMKAKETLDVWMKQGEEPLMWVDGQPYPMHPEFVYRKSGDWKGWDDFTSPDPDHIIQDHIEDVAWEMYQKGQNNE
jgi:hypothetical protein